VRIAALYDIHGNLPAFEATLAEVDRVGVDVLVCGGDVVAGPLPGECLELLRARDALFIRGNADRLVLDRVSPEEAWMDDRLTPEQRAAVRSWPETVRLELEGLGHVLFCHGSPRRDDEVLTASTPHAQVAEALAGVSEEVVVCGHTHHQFDRTIAGRRLVNAGSVGVPYEGRPGAFWALLGPDVAFRRTEYDVSAAAERLRAAGLPGLDAYLVPSLLTPISTQEAIAGMEPPRADDA
jgi:putative phosphoesterase